MSTECLAIIQVVFFIINIVLVIMYYNLCGKISKMTGTKEGFSCLLNLAIFVLLILFNPLLTVILIYLFFKKWKRLKEVSECDISKQTVRENTLIENSKINVIMQENATSENLKENVTSVVGSDKRSVHQPVDDFLEYISIIKEPDVTKFYIRDGINVRIKYELPTNGNGTVREGDIIKFTLPSGREYDMIIDKSGYLFKADSISFSRPKLLFSIFKDENTFVQHIFPNRLIVCEDEFTKQACIKGVLYGGNQNGFKFPKISIKIEFTDGKHFMTTLYNSNEVTFSKKHSLNLLMDDGTVLHLTDFSNPIKTNNHPYNRSVSTTITDKDVEIFSSALLKKWQIVNYQGIIENEYATDHGNDALNPGASKKRFCEYMQEYKNLYLDLDFQKKDTEYNELGNNSCYVYLMVDTTNQFYKIGISNNPKYREHTLQCDKPTIELLCAKEYPSRPIALSIESALHKTYGSKRIRGEWFKLDEVDIRDIEATLK